MKKIIAILLVLAIIFPSISLLNTYDIEGSQNINQIINQEPIDIFNSEESNKPVSSDIPAETTTPEPTNVPVELGDVDGSGVINANDALKVLKKAAKIESLDEELLVTADVDKNGKVDAQDSLYILQYAAKIIIRFVFDKDENISILKEYLNSNGSINSFGDSSIRYFFNDKSVSGFNVEYALLSYVENEKCFSYTYRTSNDAKNNVDIVYKLYNDEVYVDIKLQEDDGQYSYNVNASNSFKIETFQSGFDFRSNINVSKYKSNTKYEVMKTVYYNEVLDKVNAWMHIGMVSLDTCLKNTVVMSTKNIGFSKYVINPEFNQIMLDTINGLYYMSDPIVENALVNLKNHIKKNGVKDEDMIYMDAGAHLGGSSYAYHEETNNYLVYDKKQDVVFFQKSVVYTSPNQFVTAIIQPLSNKLSYCYIDIYEYDKKGNVTYIDSMESLVRSRDIQLGENYQFYYVNNPDKQVSKQDQKLGDCIMFDLVNELYYGIFRRIDNVKLYELGYWYYVS